MSDPIPEMIKHADLMMALEPLCKLLNLSPTAIMPPILIGPDQVTVTVVATEEVDKVTYTKFDHKAYAGEVAPFPEGDSGRQLGLKHPRGEDYIHAELCYVVTVKTDLDG